MPLRPLLLGGGAVGLCYFVGVPVVDWVLSAVQLLGYALSALLWAFWQLMQPAQDSRNSHLPELHQAVLNVTNDASRVADLLDEFMSQYHADPQLKSTFLQFLAQQADTKYSVVDNQLNWVLWLYSLIWMPLLVLMCLTKMGRGAAHEPRQQHIPSAVPLSSSHHQQQMGAPPPIDTLLRSCSTSGQFLSTAHINSTTGPSGAGFSPRHRPQTATGGLSDLPSRHSVPGSFGRGYADDLDGSTRSVAGSARSLRQAVTSSSIQHYSTQRANSDRMHLSRPSKLHTTTSLPPQALLVKGGGGGSSGSQKSLSGYRPGAHAHVARAFSSEFSRQGSSSGADVRSAAAVDQAALTNGARVGWALKGRQQQQQQQRLPSHSGELPGLGDDVDAVAAAGDATDMQL